MKTELHAAQTSLEKYKLSPQQRHLWKLQQTQVSDPFFTYCRVSVEGPADIAALRTAIEHVAQRHDILRTSFQILRGDDSPSPLLDVHEHKLEIFAHDLTKLSETQKAEQLAVLSRQLSEPLPGVNPCPDFRVHLLQLHEERCEMLVRVSAMCSDGGGLRSIVREIAQLYDMRTTDHEPALPAPVQYTDVSRIFNELLDEEDSSLGTEYWQRQNLLAVEWGQLGFEQRSTTSTHFAPEVFEQPLKGITPEQLKAAAEAHGATVEQWLLACWMVLLSRLTGRIEVVAGVAFANRDYDLDDAVGLFSRYIPLRSHLTSDLSFNDLLKRVARAMEEAREWQDYFSWDHLTTTNGDSNSAGAAFCEFAFDYTEGQTTYSAADLTFTIAEQYSCTDRFRLKLACTVEPGGSLDHLCLHYDSSQLRAGDVARTGGYLCTLLLGSVADPLSAVSRLPLIGQTERSELLAQMGRRELTAPTSTITLHHLFEQQVERRPHAVAVVCGDESVTYAELNEKAERLAKGLRQRGVGAETLVGLLLERSVEMVVAILGVLKAGGAYVPLDPGYPDERVRYVVEDAELRVVVTAANQAERAAGLGIEQVVCIDREESEVLGAETMGIDVTAENLCYVIYTSGSTGRPKGVMVTHANVTRLFTSTQALFDFSEQDVWTLFHSYAFDFSVWELWGALLYGGRLVVVPFWESRSPESLRRTLVEQEVTVLNQTPSAFRQFMAEDERVGRPGELSVRVVVFGGEALEMGSLRGWIDGHEDHGPRLVNMYGITETTVHVTYAEVSREEIESGGASRIGVGLSDLSVYVLDELGELVGVGMRGELYIGGAGVARGYVKRPELTAERFVPDAFSSEAGARLYRTGDLARYRADGELEYLGRIDNQVKIRGYRIELGEIEAALCGVAGVREAVVVARVEAQGEQRLVAYVVVATEQAGIDQGARLRRELAARLPDYMVPGVIVELAQLPLTANGKVDRRALPEPARSRKGSEHVVARTPEEELLCGIWAEVLGVKGVGIDENFFELGGDSILSIQIVARAARAGLRLLPKSLFQYQTVASLAAIAERVAAPVQEELSVAPEPLGPLPLTPIQQRFFALHRTATHHWNQSVLLRVQQPLTRSLLEQIVAALLRQHDALRLRFAQDEAGNWQQWYGEYDETEAARVVQCYDLSGQGEEEARRRLEVEGEQLQGSLELSAGPLLRVGYFELGEQERRLLLTIHHLAVDGVTWRILLEDLERAYEQASSGGAVELGAKTSSYGEWARRLSEYARSEQLQAETEYWLQQVDAMRASSSNGSSGRRAVEGSGKWAEASGNLTEEQTRGLLQEVGRAYGTRVTEVLLAGLLVAWEQWRGERVLGVDVEVHGREAELVGGVDVTRTAGWFTGVYPLVLALPGEWAEAAGEYGAVLKSVKEQLRAVPGGGLGYGLLRYLGRDEAVRRRLAEGGEARLSFNYLGQFDGVLGGSEEFAAAWERAGRAQAAESEREHELSVGASVGGGRLRVSVGYEQGRYAVAEIEQLVAGYVRVLGQLVEHCQTAGVGGYTPSDFPLINLGQSQLDEMFEELEFE